MSSEFKGSCRSSVPTASDLVADYIVIGGGSTGCTIASRLSEDPGVSVLLLEAGPRDASPFIHMPVGYCRLTKGPLTWGYRTSSNWDIPFEQARVLGGGSSINAQIYTRGSKEDYDHWAVAMGCEGWSYRDVLPYFRRAEANERFADQFHGTAGPLKVSDQQHTHPLTQAWLEACQQAGIPSCADFNGSSQQGCGLYQVTARGGRRSSAAVAYLGLARARTNLRIETGSQVTRLQIENRRAVGVCYVDPSGNLRVARAEREVIVSCGGIGSPKLLMLSGIGPAGELRRLGIDIHADSPEVGQNLQDHLNVFLTYELSGPFSYNRYKRAGWKLLAALQYALFRSGPAASNLVEGGAFWWADHADPSPDMQFHFVPGAGAETGFIGAPGRDGCTLNAYPLRPQSRGVVKLQSKDFRRAPLIDPRYFSAPSDLDLTVESLRLGRHVMSQPALAPYIRCEWLPGPEVQTSAHLADYARHHHFTGHHPCGACRMGPDADAVVDLELKVNGIDGLRVADASILPKLISGNTNAPAIMIGERAADLVRGVSPNRRQFAQSGHLAKPRVDAVPAD